MLGVTFVFYRRAGFLASLIKYITLGQFSHVGVRFDTGDGFTFIESLGGRKHVQWGVAEYATEYVNHEYARVDHNRIERVYFKLAASEVKTLLDHARTRVGYKYGILDFLRYAVRFLPRGKGYTCSELAAEIYEMMSGQKLRNSVSPTHLYNIVRAYKLGMYTKFFIQPRTSE